MTKYSSLEKRIDRIENILIELALYSHRCHYIYIADLKKLLLNKRLIKEKKTFVKLSEGQAKAMLLKGKRPGPRRMQICKDCKKEIEPTRTKAAKICKKCGEERHKELVRKRYRQKLKCRHQKARERMKAEK